MGEEKTKGNFKFVLDLNGKEKKGSSGFFTQTHISQGVQVERSGVLLSNGFYSQHTYITEGG